MEIIGNLIQILPLQTGVSKNGEWKKQDIIIETQGQYPKKVCIAIWGDKANPAQLQVGNQLKISFDVESREFNGRWYTDVKAWKVENANDSNAASSTAAEDNYFVDNTQEEDDNLPF